LSKIIDLKSKKLSFTRDDYIYKLELFRTTNMSVDTLVYQNDTFIKKENIAFAQLPKELKKTVKPNKK
jgi:alanine dehydrogenase